MKHDYPTWLYFYFVYFQCSLILEYCSMKNLRSYLIDHESEFRRSLEFYENNKFLDPLPSSAVSSGIPHDIPLLYRWTYQVKYITRKNVYFGCMELSIAKLFYF